MSNVIAIAAWPSLVTEAVEHISAFTECNSLGLLDREDSSH